MKILAGVRMEPASWEEAKHIIEDGTLGAFAKFGRHPIDLKKYEEFRKNEILTKYCSVTDYLYATIFGAPCAIDEGM